MIALIDAKVGTHVSHAVKAERVQIHHTNGDTILHAAGCQHRGTKKQWDYEIRTVTMVSAEWKIGSDDWFNVAPCARKA